MNSSPMLGLLRAAARRPLATPHPPPFGAPSIHLVPCRSFTHLRIQPSHPSLRVSQCQRQRAFSLFNWAKKPTAPTLQPVQIAAISRLEADANAHPHDLPKQLALFEALASSQLKVAHENIVTRWERMCEFDSGSPLLRSDRAFEFYIQSLVATDATSAVDEAVRRRESLLAATAGTSATSSTAEQPLPTPSPVSQSQILASTILAGKTPKPTSTSSPPSDSTAGELAAALGSGAGVRGKPIHVTISEPKGAMAFRLLRFVLLTAVGGFFILVILAVFLENSGLLKAGRQPAEFEPLQGKTVMFSDVHGVDEAKDELKDIVEFLKNPTMFATLGGKLPKGVLLTGPPGTGKTMLAKAVAGEAGVPFLYASGSEFEEMFVGVGAKRVRELFAHARKKQPAIIFIDELDAIGGKRTQRDAHYMKQTLNQLLVEMDGFQQMEGVIVIAATNFPESLDQALIRPGRFDRHVAVPLPDVRGRVQILHHHMKGVVTEGNVDVPILARGTPGFSGADLQNMVNLAAVQAAKEGAMHVALKHFEWAKDRILLGAERRSTYISEEVKKVTAYHEGGHALVALYTDGAMPLHKVTCMPRGHALGITSQLPKDDRYSVSFKELLAEIDVCMGGRVAEELIYGRENVTTGCTSDLRAATSKATHMVKDCGMSDTVGPVSYDENTPISAEKRSEIEREIRSLLVAGEDRVRELLTQRVDELHRLAQALVDYETMDLEEVQKVIKGEPIRDIQEIISEDLANAAGA